MVTVGYGDIIPVTTNTRIFTILVYLISSGFFGFIMSKIGMIFQDIEIRFENR
jgi:hypothetical protein